MATAPRRNLTNRVVRLNSSWGVLNPSAIGVSIDLDATRRTLSFVGLRAFRMRFWSCVLPNLHALALDQLGKIGSGCGPSHSRPNTSCRPLGPPVVVAEKCRAIGNRKLRGKCRRSSTRISASAGRAMVPVRSHVQPVLRTPNRQLPLRVPPSALGTRRVGQPTGNLIERRRRAEFITPIPKPKKREGSPKQEELVLDEGGASPPRNRPTTSRPSSMRSAVRSIPGATCPPASGR